jgi:hypothetical protein
MKTLILALTLFSQLAFSYSRDQFKITQGKLHTGGVLSVETGQVINRGKDIILNFQYKINKKLLVPVPSEYLQGNYRQIVPVSFLDERGFIELSRVKRIKVPEGTMVYVGRVSYGNFRNAYKLKILADNKMSEIEIIYHPHQDGMGWAKLKLTIFTDIPMFNNYIIEGVPL